MGILHILHAPPTTQHVWMMMMMGFSFDRLNACLQLIRAEAPVDSQCVERVVPKGEREGSDDGQFKEALRSVGRIIWGLLRRKLVGLLVG